MTILLTGRMNSYIQFITVLLIFVGVLGLTAWTTKWISKYQKQQMVNCNVEVIETTRIANNKFVQIIRVGETYMAVAVCKDTVTMLGEIPKEQLKEGSAQESVNFKELFERAVKKDSRTNSEPKDEIHDITKS